MAFSQNYDILNCEVKWRFLEGGLFDFTDWNRRAHVHVRLKIEYKSTLGISEAENAIFQLPTHYLDLTYLSKFCEKLRNRQFATSRKKKLTPCEYNQWLRAKSF